MGVMTGILIAAQLLPILTALANGMGGKLQQGSMNKYLQGLPTPTPGPTPGPGGTSATLPTYKPTMGGKIGGALQLGGAALGLVTPYILRTLGRTAQAGGNAAGAVAQAIGNAPGHILNGLTSDAQRARFGGDIFSGIGGIASDVGAAANATLSGVGNVVGSVNDDIANAMQMRQLQERYMRDMAAMAQQVQTMNLSPGAWGALQRGMSGLNPASASRALNPSAGGRAP
jgi:hypothetical protein